MPLNDQDESLGGLLVGTWVNTYFFMTGLILCYRYFAEYRNDPMWLKLMVVIILAVDLTSTTNHCVCVYLYGITYWGRFIDPFSLQSAVNIGYDSSSVLPTSPVHFEDPANAETSNNNRSIGLDSVKLLDPSRYILVLLVIFSMSGMAGSIATAVITTQHPGYEGRGIVRVPVTIWLGLSAVTDVSITAILIRTLQRVKTDFWKTRK
ncbi:hypothetical protein Moror_14956 [Moniliophthora roreri MCA 2997]|uniref:Uncharacterized protein n=1 Tax=Moniliophthora roreri (strain MCA 2997) TaxID=1381753 RepID=V2WWC9_MONRO|nr:hypothetical protein Moror_14956 [Moniliophthora roreri MCA 2997]